MYSGNIIYLHFLLIQRFITGPPDIKNEQNLGKIPRVYINTDVENEECYLLVYRAHNASVCILINGRYCNIVWNKKNMKKGINLRKIE